MQREPIGPPPVSAQGRMPTPLLESLLARQPLPLPLAETQNNLMLTAGASPSPALLQRTTEAAAAGVADCLGGLAVQLDQCSSNTSDDTNSPASSNTSQYVSSDAHSNGSSQTSPSHESAEQQYRQRRKRNNEAAKKCRANRRALFEQRLSRARQLEVENEQLREESSRLSSELAELKRLLDVKHPGGWKTQQQQETPPDAAAPVTEDSDSSNHTNSS